VSATPWRQDLLCLLRLLHQGQLVQLPSVNGMPICLCRPIRAARPLVQLASGAVRK